MEIKEIIKKPLGSLLLFQYLKTTHERASVMQLEWRDPEAQRMTVGQLLSVLTCLELMYW